MLKWSRSWEHWYRRALPAYWVFLFCATHFPRPRLPGELPAADKLVHVVGFGLLAFLFWRFAESFNRDLSARFFWLALLVLSAYAAADEYLQQFVNRQTSRLDWLADVAGILLVLVPLELRRRWSRSSTATGGKRPEC